MKRISNIIFTALITMLILGPVSWAGDGGYGPKGKRFGVGLYMGEPTGITLKGYVSSRLAIDGIAAWSFYEDAVTFIGDVTYDFVDLPIHSATVRMPFYAGAGGKIAVDRSGRDRDRTTGAIRIPVGIGIHFNNHPVEISFEVAPGIQVAPATSFDLTGGVAVRLYF